MIDLFQYQIIFNQFGNPPLDAPTLSCPGLGIDHHDDYLDTFARLAQGEFKAMQVGSQSNEMIIRG